MFWLCAALSAAGMLESAICSCLAAEWAGYWLQRLFPSVRPLGKRQIVQQLLAFGPRLRMRTFLEGAAPGYSSPSAGFRPKYLAVSLQRYRLTMSLAFGRGEDKAERETSYL